MRLSLPRQLKEHMLAAYGIRENFLYLRNVIFQGMDNIKQIRLYPPEADGTCKVIAVYEVPDTDILPDNGRYLGIDLGLHNLMSCYDSSGRSFIVGRKYLDICRSYDKEIARVQSQWAAVQSARGVKYLKPSKHLLSLYSRKKDCINDYLHKVTRYIISYCTDHGIHTVIVGDLTGIRKDNNLGHVTNQKLHSLPYARIYIMLGYKLRMEGIRFVCLEESYSSQCPPDSPEVSAAYAVRNNRKHRGLYICGDTIYNADSVGAYNILRKYLLSSGSEFVVPPMGLSGPQIIKVAV